MNFDLDMIQKMWEKDSIIDPDNLHTESLKIPALHAKYFDNEYFRLIIATVKDYFERFEKVPNWSTLETILRVEIKEKILGTKDMNITQENQIQKLI